MGIIFSLCTIIYNENNIKEDQVIAGRYKNNNQIVLGSHKYESKLVTKSLHGLLLEIRLPLWPWQLIGGHVTVSRTPIGAQPTVWRGGE